MSITTCTQREFLKRIWSWLKVLQRKAKNVVAVQSLSHVWLFATPWTVGCLAPLSSTVSWSLHKFMSTESVMLFNHALLCFPLFLLPSILSSIKVSSSELSLLIRWPKYPNCGAGEDSRESLALQGDPTSQSYRKSGLNSHGRTEAEAPIFWPPDAKKQRI